RTRPSFFLSRCFLLLAADQTRGGGRGLAADENLPSCTTPMREPVSASVWSRTADRTATRTRRATDDQSVPLDPAGIHSNPLERVVGLRGPGAWTPVPTRKPVAYLGVRRLA